MEALNNA